MNRLVSLIIGLVMGLGFMLLMISEDAPKWAAVGLSSLFALTIMILGELWDDQVRRERRRLEP